jgi:hypothetical protein
MKPLKNKHRRRAHCGIPLCGSGCHQMEKAKTREYIHKPPEEVSGTK